MVETNHENLLHSNDQWISLHVQVHTPWGKCPIDDYNHLSLALLILVSRLNARNSPGGRPYCNRLPLKNFADRMKLRKFYNTKNFHANYFDTKTFRSMVLHIREYTSCDEDIFRLLVSCLLPQRGWFLVVWQKWALLFSTTLPVVRLSFAPQLLRRQGDCCR